MKCYFCLTAPDEANGVYIDLLHVALKSARENTTLDLCALYDGPEDHPCYSLLSQYKVKIRKHVFSHKEDLIKTFPESYLKERFGKVDSYEKIAGTFMRLDVPFVETEEEYVLYADLDVYFAKDIAKAELKLPKFLAAAPEFSKDIEKMTYFNAGVLLFNVRNMRVKCGEIFSMLKRGERNSVNLFDQGYLNQVCFSNMDLLPLECNWKPYWGINKNATIVHFHGMKPGGDFFSSGFDMTDKAIVASLNGHVQNIGGYLYYFLKFFECLGKNGDLWLAEFLSRVVSVLHAEESKITTRKMKSMAKQYVFQKLHLGGWK